MTFCGPLGGPQEPEQLRERAAGLSFIDISYRYPSPVILTGISHRYLSSVSLTDASQRYLSSVSLMGISAR